MKESRIKAGKFTLHCISANTLVIGSGAASLNAAFTLHSKGQHDILIATDNWGGGTSNNTGSDKQTYYKLSLSGGQSDSFLEMANDLFNGQCMHGDIALCEAQGSVRAFMNLVSLGVKFPENRYGAWVGYKTDHDPRARATSAGPYTSKRMFEGLAAEVERLGIVVMNRIQVVALLTSRQGKNKKIVGALALDLLENDPLKAFVLYNSVNTILGTGGPAAIYQDSVYPLSQSGYSGMAYEAGAAGQNLTESQFGIASIKFRWNLSGSYQQVIPVYYSTDANGNDRREFLNEFFTDIRSLTRAIFLKGYQWPFDPRKIEGSGSSLIDVLVYREKTEKGRRVFMDWRRNPSGPRGEDFSVDMLDEEVAAYLVNSGATGRLPVDRLKKLNSPALDLYLDNGIDLRKEPLEIAVCAQHNNGGLKGNIWWESDLQHLFPVGEVNGSHGVYRPGGSALNSGQVGSYRAATYISRVYRDAPPADRSFYNEVRQQVLARLELAGKWMTTGKKLSPAPVIEDIRRRMSEAGAIVRSEKAAVEAVKEAKKLLSNIDEMIAANSVTGIARGFLLRDMCLTHYLYLSAISTYLERGGRGRGSYMVIDREGKEPAKGIGKAWRFSLCKYDRDIETGILEVSFRGGRFSSKLVPVRPIPEQELWFETVWKKNLEDKFDDC
ncbi:MAG: FAD-binding protein [Bacteroidales bacterium]